MTTKEKMIADALLKCTFLPGSFDKKFVRGFPNRQDKPMTQEGRAMMLGLFVKYRKQILTYEEICEFIFRQDHL